MIIPSYESRLVVIYVTYLIDSDLFQLNLLLIFLRALYVMVLEMNGFQQTIVFCKDGMAEWSKATGSLRGRL